MKRLLLLLLILVLVLGGFLVMSSYGLGIWDWGGDRLVQVDPEAAEAGALMEEGEEDRSDDGEAERRQGSRVALDAGKVCVIQGQVIDELSDPIVGAVVVLHRMPGAGDLSRMGPALARARSGEDGRFHFGEQSSGTYRLIVRAPGWCTSWTQVWIEKAPQGAEDLSVQLVAGYGLQGRVVGPEGKGLPGAWILASWSSSGGWIDTWSEVRGDAEGRFSFSALPADRVPLLTWVEGFGLGLTRVDASRADQARIELDRSSPYKMSFSLAEPPKEGLGNPSDVLVQLTLTYDSMRLLLPTPIRNVRIPVAGQIEVNNLRKAEFEISAHSEQMVIREASRTQELDPEHPVARIRLAWETGFPVKGRLVYEDGSPARKVSFWISGDNHQDGFRISCDSEGRFEPSERFYAHEKVLAMTASPEFRFVDQFSSESCSILKPGEEENVVPVLRTPLISGRVVDEKGKPLSHVLVALVPGTAPGWEVVKSHGITNIKGEFRVKADPKADEPLVLKASHSSMVSPEPWRLDGKGRSAEDGLLLRLVHGAQVEGSVVDGKGRGIAGVLMEVEREASHWPENDYERGWDHHPTVSNREGFFKILGLCRGKWRIRPVTHGYVIRGSSPVLQLKPGEKKSDLRLVLVPGLTIRGRLLTDSGKPLAGVDIEASHAGDLDATEPGVVRNTVTGPDGSFVLEDLRAGDYDLEATLPAELCSKLGVDRTGPDGSTQMWDPYTPFKTRVPAGSRGYRWKIHLPRFGSIQARLAWSGEPLNEVEVELRSKDEKWSFEIPVVGGLVLMKNVLAGSYDIRFRTSKYADVDRKVSVLRDKESDLGILTLMDAPRVKGRVVDADGKSLVGVRISVDPDVERSWTTCEIEKGKMKLAGDVLTRSDAQGRFEVVLHRRAMIYGYKLGYAPGSIASAEEVLLVLPKSGRLSVATPPSATEEVWRLELTRMTVAKKSPAKAHADPWSRSFRENAGVTIPFRGLLPGRYILRAANLAKLSDFQERTIAGESYCEEILIQAGTDRLIQIR